ncbi:MAG: hypothetical protein LC798_08625, partial [Chloroflexi bacterium]|nr:hypothetical protein [Chloroflexota bacterium]
TRQLRGVLDEEGGGAVRAIRALVDDPATEELDPIMITGRTVLVAERWSELCLAEMRAFFADRELEVTLTGHPVEPGLVEIEGEGGAWRPRHYVAVVTDLLERGVTRCVVGTRGLLGEGWDSLSLNTLIDLTTAGTYASVNQIRGRSIRLDPAEPHKVANNWDLVCYEPDLDEGDRDLERLKSKHRHTWGLGSGDRIVRGIGHVDERIPMLGLPLFGPLGRRLMTAAVVAVDGLRLALALPPPWNLVTLAAVVLIPVAVAAPLFWRYVKAGFIEVPVDSHLADFGRAVAEAYRSKGLAPMSPDQVRVRINPSGTYDVVLDSHDKAVVDQFAVAYAELFEPIVDQRYLITRNEGDISGTFYAPIWYVLRAAFAFARRSDTAYHAVPTAFARRRDMADAFATAWRRWVGGGELVYTRSPDGMETLMRERVALRTSVRAASVEEWR